MTRAPVCAILLLLALAGAQDARARSCPPQPPPQRVHRITHPRWLPNTIVTEYWPAPERWSAGRLVAAPGLPGRHSVDWLYGAHGLPMEGEGVGRDGRVYHFAGPYDLSWVNAGGARTSPCWDGSWTNGGPAWLDLGWRAPGGAVTFPLAGGGWSAGRPARVVPAGAVPRFAPGRSRPLAYWRSVAVDPQLIPLGSLVFVPAYCASPARGWFRAEDTGGAIIARHLDVYRPPPPIPEGGQMLRGQRVYVVPPGFPKPKRPSCA